jgi:hypothetical protein
MPAVNNCIEHFSGIWEKSPAVFPEFKRSYLREEQELKESRFNGIQEKLKKLQSKKSRRELMSSEAGKTFFPMFRNFLESIFDFDSENLNIILSDSFKNVSKDFYYQARKFGPELIPESIYQGLRNVWIMNSLQLMMGLPVVITPSVFAYSMIYPYSDNLLDDAELSGEEKQEFSIRFNQRLHGEALVPVNFTELQLFRLVALIESQFPRNEFPEVYESLYAIQRGQTRSLELINCNGLEDAVIREICFEKGGASVLADGYLVAGRLTAEQERAVFGYGIYLQLLDDIQDAGEDTLAFTKTMFACRGRSSDLETFLYKTIHFGREAMEELRCFKGTDMDSMLQLMNHSIESMVIESVGLNPEYWSDTCLKSMEVHSPLSFDYIRKKKAKSKSQRFDLFKKYFEQAPEGFIPPKNSTAN